MEIDVDDAPDDALEVTFREDLIRPGGHKRLRPEPCQLTERFEIAGDEQGLPGHELPIDHDAPARARTRATYSRSSARNRLWSWYRLNA